MREERLDVGDVFQNAQHRDDVGFGRGFGRKLTRVEITDDGLRVPRHQIATLVRAAVGQEALQRHLPAAEIEHACAGGNELRGELGARVPCRLQRSRIGPARSVGLSRERLIAVYADHRRLPG